MKPRPRLRSILGVRLGAGPRSLQAVTSASLLISGIQAQTTQIWDGISNGNFWDYTQGNKTNWLGNGIPTAGDDLEFTGTRRTTNSNNFANGTSFNSINFDANAGAFILSGNRIAIGASGITNNSSNLQTIALPLTLGAATTFHSGASGLTLSNLGVVDGSGGISKTGSGTLTLSGINTYTGGTVIRAGTVLLSGSGTLGASTNNLTVSSSGSDGSDSAILNLNGLTRSIGTLTLGGLGATGPAKNNTVQTGAGTLTLGGNITFANDATANQGGGIITGNLALGATRSIEVGSRYTGEGSSTAVISAAISGSGFGITKTGTGLLSLSGTNSYTGTTTLQAGTLLLNSAGALGGNGNLSFTGGTLRYSANNTADLSGRLTLGAGTLRVDTNGQNVTWASTIGSGQTGGLAKSGTGTLTLSGSNAYTGETNLSGGTLALASNTAIGSGTLALAGGTLAPSGAARSLSNALRLDAASTLDGGSLGLTISGDLTTSDVAGAGIADHGVLTLTGSANSSLSGTLSQGTNNPYDLAKTGTGTWTLSGNNSFIGQTTLSAGTLQLTHANALGIRSGADTLLMSGGNLILAADSATTFGPGSGYGTTLGSNATITLDRLSAGAGLAHQIGGLTMGAQTLTLEKGANVSSGTAKLVVGGASVFTANPTFNLGSGTELHFGSNMTGAVNLTKVGAGVLTMNVGSGLADVTVNAGQLNINWFQGLGTSAGTLTLASGVTLDNTSAAALSVANPKSITLGASGGSGTLSFLGTQSLGMGSGTVTLTGNTTFDVTANTLTFGGDVTGAFGITKTGAGTLELAGLSGSGSYSGNTVIDDGVLFLSGSSSFKSGTTITVNTGGTLRVGPSATTEGATVVVNGGSQDIQGVIVANLSFASNSTLDPGSQAYNGTVTIQSGVTATSSADFFGTVPGSAQNSRIVIQSGATLASTSSFTIHQRKGIQIGTLTGTADGSATFSPGAGTQILLPSSIIGDAALVKTGAGNIRLIGDNSYRGGTVINQGIIGFFDDASLGLAGTSVTLNNGTIVGASPDASRTDSQNKTATIGSSRSVFLGDGTTNSMDAQTQRVLVYDGIIAESSGVANLEFGLAGTRNGIVRLGGLNTYSGTTTVEAGVVEITHFGNGGAASGIGDSSNAAGNLILGGPTAGGTLRYTGASPASSDRLFTLGIGGGTLDGGSQGITLTNTGSIGLNGNSARTLTLDGAGTSSLAASLADDGVGNLTSVVKSGDGTWTLSGTNTHTGDTTLSGGLLVISSDANLGSAVSPGGIVFSGGNLRTTGALTTARQITLSSAATLETTGNAVVLNGEMGGSGTFSVTGASGSLRLTANNSSYTGSFAVGEGVALTATRMAALNNRSVSLANGASLELAGTFAGAETFAGAITGTGALLRTGAGTSIGLTGADSNSFTGLTTVTGGTLRLEKNDGLGDNGSNLNARGISGNALVNGGALILSGGGSQMVTSAVVTLQSGTFEFSPNPLAGRSETIAQLIQSGGQFTTSGNALTVGTLELSGSGTTRINRSAVNANNDGSLAGTLTVSNSLTFGGSGDTTITIDAAASGSANRLVLGGDITVSTTGGTARILNGAAGAVSGELSLGGSSRTFQLGSGETPGNLAISAAITNGGENPAGLTLSGPGTLTLSGTNTYTGATQVGTGSTLIVGENSSGSITSSVTVAANATLGGSGIITGDVTISGTHSPGNSPGIQTITGNAAYTSSSIFDWELISNTSDPLTRGTQFDGVNISGDLSVDPDAVFNIVLNLPGSTVDFSNAFWSTTQSWLVFDVAGSILSTFQNFTVSLDSTGNTFNPPYTAGGFSMTGGTLEWNPIPEPSTALVGLLLGGLLLRRHRQAPSQR